MVIAVDFDGTLCVNEWPDIGEPNTELIELLIQRRNGGDKLILWTMRESYSLLNAIYWCDDHGLQFDAINDNLQELKDKYHNNPRKVYADIYIDDHNALIKELLAGGAP